MSCDTLKQRNRSESNANERQNTSIVYYDRLSNKVRGYGKMRKGLPITDVPQGLTI